MTQEQINDMLDNPSHPMRVGKMPTCPECGERYCGDGKTECVECVECKAAKAAEGGAQ